MLLHVSILRSSSGSVHCSLLKLYFKILITLLYLLVMWQHIVCMCICCIACREVGRLASRPTSLQAIDTTYTYTRYAATSPINITKINLLTYNFSKEQCALPEDDLRIETCRNILSLMFFRPCVIV